MTGKPDLARVFTESAAWYAMNKDYPMALVCVENALACRGIPKRYHTELTDIANALAVDIAEQSWKK